MSLSNIKDTERWHSAGMRKRLEVCKSRGFHPSRLQDHVYVKHINSLQAQDWVETLASYLPELYITIKIPAISNIQRTPSLFVRRTGKALKYMQQLPVYDISKSVHENIPNIKTEIAVDAGNGRLAYPFEVFYGRGVVAAELNDSCVMGDWYKVSHLQASTGCMEIS